MSKLAVSVGLDYHADFVQVCVLSSSGDVLVNQKVDNDWRCVQSQVGTGVEVKGVALEACCGAAHLADELKRNTGWRVVLGHPGYVARMKGSPDKTDFGDARLLADLVRVDYLPVVWLATKEIRELRRLVRFRNQRVKEKRNAKLRIRGLLREHRLKCNKYNAWTESWLAWLGEQAKNFSESDRWILEQHLLMVAQLTNTIRLAEQRLRAITKDDPVVKRLLNEPGVGLITAVTLRAEVGDFDRFKNGKQLARFCSVTPRNASSGHRQADAGVIKAGSPLLRSVLIEAAHRMINMLATSWSKKAFQMLERGKPKNVVVSAIANRWVRWLHHQVTSEALAS
jgi:transposase